MTKLDAIAMNSTEFQIVGCTMEFVCEKLWSELQLTADPKVRNCSSCMKPVTFCADQTALDQLAAGGACVALLLQEGSALWMTVGLPSGRSGKLRLYLDDLSG